MVLLLNKIKRNKSFLLWVSEDELNDIKIKAHKGGLSQQEYVRQTLAGSTVKERPSKNLLQAIKLLQSISNNMNQIAMRANATNMIDALSYRKEVNKLQLVISDSVTGDLEWR